MKKTPNTPFYVQMIQLLQQAVALLDEQGRGEILNFILNNQHEDGGFCDRGGRSDLYYSLFGLLILRALEESEEKSAVLCQSKESSAVETHHHQLLADAMLKLKHFTRMCSAAEVPGFIERCCLVLLQKELKSKKSIRAKALWSLSRSFWKERSSINLSYRSFVLFLTLDALFPVSAVIKRPARRMMAQTLVNEHSPCSEVAANVFLQTMIHQKDAKEEELLRSFACQTGGFKAFLHLSQADMLSTAVALFALNYSRADLRLLKPSTLHFIQANYFSGAFLSGDGDLTADVEYTFYGLLALGLLAD